MFLSFGKSRRPFLASLGGPVRTPGGLLLSIQVSPTSTLTRRTDANVPTARGRGRGTGREHARRGPDAEGGVAVALDAGQFRGSLPWGWVVHRGRELLAPGSGPLAGAVVVDSSGAVRVVPPDAVGIERARGTAREAFQSYPMLLQHGTIPAPLIEPGRGVDLDHRDARLALGTLSDGRVVIALTRFDALGGVLGRIPFGLTSPEMAAVMGALGCREALLLDGGVSGQLLLRDADGAARVWPGIRRVPLGLVGKTRR